MRRPMLRGMTSVMVLSALLLGCAGGREVRLADQFAVEGNWEAALIFYREAFQKRPKDLDLRRKLEEAKVQSAALHYERGQKLLDQGEILAALEEYKKALSLDPTKQGHREALQRALQLKEARDLYEGGIQLMDAGHLSDARSQFEEALERDPSLTVAQVALEEVNERQQMSAQELGLVLQSEEPITLKFRDTKLNEVFEFLSKAVGINILFDNDVRPETIKVTIFIKDASFKEALNLLLTTNNLFMKKINDNTILIVPNTRQKVKQYQDLMIRTFYLSNVPAKDMVNLLRTMLETRRVFVNEPLNALIMRDTPEKVDLAAKIIEANDRMLAEVMLEVEVLEVNRTKSLDLGWNFSPGQVQARLGPFSSSDTTSTNTGEFSFAVPEANTIFFTVPKVIVDFLKQESDAETLANPRIRVVNGETAKINIGDKQPILLSTTTTAAVATGSSPTTSTATNVEFKDVGIKVDVEPKVHLNGDVTMKLRLEITSLGDKVDLGSGVEQFRFGNRSAETVLSVGSGETVVIGGLIRDEDRVTLNKVPGLGDIPLLGKLFTNTSTGKVKTDILLTIKPTVIRPINPPEERLRTFWSGTEEDYATEPLFSDIGPVGEVSVGPASGGQPSSPAPPLPPPFPGIAPPVFPPTPQPIPPTPNTIIPDRGSLLAPPTGRIGGREERG